MHYMAMKIVSKYKDIEINKTTSQVAFGFLAAASMKRFKKFRGLFKFSMPVRSG